MKRSDGVNADRSENLNLSDGNGATSRKLAEVISERIEMSIIDRGWPVGEVI